MQKVVGSNPISRFTDSARSVLVHGPGVTH